jgi:hypothetical protein
MGYINNSSEFQSRYSSCFFIAFACYNRPLFLVRIATKDIANSNSNKLYMSSEPNQHNERSTNTLSGRKLALISLLTLLAAIFIALFWGETANLFGLRRFFSSARSAGTLSAPTSITVATAMDSSVSGEKLQSAMKTPVYFLSHGGVSPSRRNIQRRNLKLIPASQTSCTKSSTRPTANWHRSAARSRQRSSRAL